MTTTTKNDVQKREGSFASRTATRIWQEEAAPHNPYLAASCRCHGYDLLELVKGGSVVEVFFLLFRGELPDKAQADLLEALMIGLMNPGPRHPATRAAMNAGVGKTSPAHILPIGLAVLGGDHLGGEEVMAGMRFFRKNSKSDPAALAAELLAMPRPAPGDYHIAPGFGTRYGGIDPIPQAMASHLQALPGSGKALRWGEQFAAALKPAGMGWLASGVAAATFCDLGFHPRAGAGLFQLLCAPGLLAHGLEMANKPITAMPFLDEEHYVIAPDARRK